MAPPVVATGRYWIVPTDWYPKMEQGGVIMKHAQDPAAALAFRSFLLGQEGRAILKRFGFYTEP
jgi:molybdate transport system substrate-binding protein